MTITGPCRRADHIGADDAMLGSVGYAPFPGWIVAVLRDERQKRPANWRESG